jgi:DNA polymerase IV
MLSMNPSRKSLICLQRYDLAISVWNQVYGPPLSMALLPYKKLAMSDTANNSMTNLRAILHVDMDAFYAAIEQRDRPELRGLPVIIAHEGKRGVVSTASYEARRFGVRSALPTVSAKRLCPQGIIIEPRLRYYSEVSREVFAVFADYTPEIEGLSLDEAFLDVSRSIALFGSALEIAHQLKQQVYQRTQLSCSVGVAHNKLMAKLASELCKPNGVLEVRPEQIQTLLDPLAVEKLWTIGAATQRQLNAIGVQTIGQLRRTNPARLQAIFQRQTGTILQLASGIDERPVEASRQEKSIGAEQTFGDDLTELSALKAVLMTLAERVSARLRAHGLVARTLSVKLRKPPFETHTRQRQLHSACAETEVLYRHAEQLLTAYWQEQSRLAAPSLRLLGLSASELFDVDANAQTQQDLFAPGASAKASAADRLADAINQRFAAEGKRGIQRARGIAAKTADDA